MEGWERPNSLIQQWAYPLLEECSLSISIPYIPCLKAQSSDGLRVDTKVFFSISRNTKLIRVLYPEGGVCADPVDKGAILGEGGGKPPSSDKGRQLATDIVGGKT